MVIITNFFTSGAGAGIIKTKEIFAGVIKMTDIIKSIIGSAPDSKWAKKMLWSLVVPALIVVGHPFGLSMTQAGLFAAIVLVIIWWSFGTVTKVTASVFLIEIFLLFGIPVKTVFSFPLSETFLLILFCYLFSRGIENSEIAQKALGPILYKYVNTPLKAILSAIALLLLGMYLIPQPLARLLMIVCLIKGHLDHTDASEQVKKIILFGIFVFYATVNMIAMRADIILNTSAAGFAGLALTEQDWLKAMAIPTILYSILVFLFFCFLFRKDVFGIHFHAGAKAQMAGETIMQAKDKRMAAIMAVTVVLWATTSVHGISARVVTLFGILLMFCNGNVKLKDVDSIDIITLVFLTAAFSIGGAMKASGIAEHVFGALAAIFPRNYSPHYVLIVIGVSMAMHLILGSNTTTLSIVAPGLVAICGEVMPEERVFFIAFFAIAAQYILPFHSVAMMIGTSNSYFPSNYVTKMGLPLTFLVIASVFCLYIPWWDLIGLI